MQVFISWSGELSKKVAMLFKDWIEDVLQGTDVWISTDDIDKGSIWFGDINEQLRKTSVGILFLTRENINAPWVLFEAGALSKGLEKNRVCPILVNIDHSDLKPPLSQFNGTLPTKSEFLKLVKTINSHNSDMELPDEKLKKAFTRWWDDYEKGFQKILSEYNPTSEKHKRPQEDMVEEILQIVRSLQGASQKIQNEPLVHILGQGRSGKTGLLYSWLSDDKKKLDPKIIFIEDPDSIEIKNNKKDNDDEDDKS